jgi:phage shock protein A
MTTLEDRETLLRYRLEQAEETLEDAQKMLSSPFGTDKKGQAAFGCKQVTRP